MFCYGKRVIHLDPEIPNGALDLRMAKKELYRGQISGTAIDEGCFGASKGMRSKNAWIEPYGTDPLPDQAGILPGRQARLCWLRPGNKNSPGRLPAFFRCSRRLSESFSRSAASSPGRWQSLFYTKPTVALRPRSLYVIAKQVTLFCLPCER